LPGICRGIAGDLLPLAIAPFSVGVSHFVNTSKAQMAIVGFLKQS
jgi:hypothetical protein